MPRVIVCGADGSDESLAAAEVAGRLAKRLRGRVVVGRALGRARPFPYGDHPGEAEHVFERVAERASEAEIDGREVRGEPAQALVALADMKMRRSTSG